MSTPFSCSSLAIQVLVRSMFRLPSCLKPTDETVSSCICSPSERNSGSISSTLSSSKAFRSRTLAMPTLAFWQRRIGAYLLISRSFDSTLSRSSSLTRSILFTSNRSANATCSTASFSTPSAFSSSRCCSTCAASTIVTMPSRRANCLIDSSMKNVCATGPGSASPVVSTMMASSCLPRCNSFVRMRIRSPRTVQQMQPLFISKMSSVVLKRSLTSASSTPTSPNSFSITAIFLP
mmetsp:Transcript_13046/g.29781  ORF Transcript_13046/g.29781 Transcript_13046/m.29781 type:complete len:235 (+) Transcript_13046:663-1367(+)